jgi:hypothetical protein
MPEELKSIKSPDALKPHPLNPCTLRHHHPQGHSQPADFLAVIEQVREFYFLCVFTGMAIQSDQNP